ncbi:PREDICTED: uncharacterized protein LOC108568444 [Nicrophorus vespilloides]|uniref:Uncharacterized protein LOC108568444 n=1 Tax=Nicrophorus vespilloides TaxID=110193 RepID=A0ABM1NDX5_NICVS|nr:PREDICTED: uncharacterized protein LOC108568444 [Nicrophorus vespilloides]
MERRPICQTAVTKTSDTGGWQQSACCLPFDSCYTAGPHFPTFPHVLISIFMLTPLNFPPPSPHRTQPLHNFPQSDTEKPISIILCGMDFRICTFSHICVYVHCFSYCHRRRHYLADISNLIDQSPNCTEQIIGLPIIKRSRLTLGFGLR